MGEEGEDQQNGTASPPASDPNDGLIVAPIKVIIPGVMSDDDSDEEERRVVKKKKKKKKKAAAEIDQLTAEEEKKMDKTMMLTKTFGQAIRLINEQKAREKQKARQEEIRLMALEQKARQGLSNQAPVIIHF